MNFVLFLIFSSPFKLVSQLMVLRKEPARTMTKEPKKTSENAALQRIPKTSLYQWLLQRRFRLRTSEQCQADSKSRNVQRAE